MLHYKPTTKDDLVDVEQLNGDEFSFKHGELSIVDGIIRDDSGKAVAFGIVKPRAEAIFIADKTLPKVSRGKALKMLMDVAIHGTKAKNINQLHVFIKDKNLAESMIKHYGFQKVEEIVLVKNLHGRD